jgi:hypothetical protein
MPQPKNKGAMRSKAGKPRQLSNGPDESIDVATGMSIPMSPRAAPTSRDPSELRMATVPVPAGRDTASLAAMRGVYKDDESGSAAAVVPRALPPAPRAVHAPAPAAVRRAPAAVARRPAPRAAATSSVSLLVWIALAAVLAYAGYAMYQKQHAA